MAKRAKVAPAKVKVEPIESARIAGLRYVDDGAAGWGRVPAAVGFTIVDERRKPVRDREAVARVKALAIPPAWSEVWICPRADGHLQATGRDGRGRKQYRYHPTLAGRPRRDEVYAHDRLRGCPRAAPGGDRARPCLARPAAREGARGRRPAARNDPHPRRQRGVRPPEQVVRPDHHARRAREGRRQGRPLHLPGKERRAALDRPPRPSPGQDRQALPGPARPGAFPVPRRGRQAATRSTPPT